jgi:hypothetical protein
MDEARKTYVSAAVFFERLADDGWPEDAGRWPISGCTSAPIKSSHRRAHGVRRLSPSGLVKSLLQNRRRT